MRRRALFILGIFLLTTSLLLGALITLSCFRQVSLRGPGDRWRLTLGYADLGAGALEFDQLRDPTATFMFPYEPLGPRHPAGFAWTIPRLNYNPPMVAHPPNGWGVHEWPGVAWLVDSAAMRTAAMVAWPLPFPPLALGLYLTLRHRPRPRGACPTCGYNRSTLPSSSPCPECGTAPPSPRLP